MHSRLYMRKYKKIEYPQIKIFRLVNHKLREGKTSKEIKKNDYFGRNLENFGTTKPREPDIYISICINDTYNVNTEKSDYIL